jgi:hypothetical protein
MMQWEGGPLGGLNSTVGAAPVFPWIAWAIIGVAFVGVLGGLLLVDARGPVDGDVERDSWEAGDAEEVPERNPPVPAAP